VLSLVRHSLTQGTQIKIKVFMSGDNRTLVVAQNISLSDLHAAVERRFDLKVTG
jgi:hypothetical protein